jgi:hypothetical protein
MVRQAHTYLVGAMSGATLIAAAIAVFVVLVTALVFRDWPIAGLGGSGADSASTSGHEATGPSAGDGAAANGAASGAGGAAAAQAGGRTAKPGSKPAADGATGATFQPGGSAPGGEAGGGNGAGSAPQGAASPGSPGSTASGGGSNGGAGGGGAGTAGGGSSTSGSVANTVNETVNQVDQTVTGGALEQSGVTGVTEGVVEGALGPESTVGQAVDGAADTVGGLLHPNR